jgi:hypothetical protein
MSVAKTSVSWWMQLLLLVPGCRTAEKITYTHAATDGLVKSYNLDDPAIAPFRGAGVVAAPFVVPLDYTDTAIKVVFLAPAPATVTVREATLSDRPLVKDTSVAVDEPTAKAGVVERAVTLGTLPTVDLDALGKDGLVLTMVLVGADGGNATLKYTFDRHVETYMVMR